MWSEPEWLDDDWAVDKLAGAPDADELCRLLLQKPWGWGSSSRSSEAVDLLRRLRGTGNLPASLLALLLCTCGRWSRFTAKVIDAIESSGVLTDDDLDELAEAFASEVVVVEYPLLWVLPQGFQLDPSDESAPVITEATVGTGRRHPEPPLRRWAAARVLRNEPGRLEELLAIAGDLPEYARDALIHGLLDAAGVLDVDARRRLVRRGLRSGIGRVRKTALDRLCELDGPEVARRQARTDGDSKVRAWRPRVPAHS